MNELNSIPSECFQFMDNPYKKGTIKLTWIDPKDYKKLNSRMFNSVNEALKNLPESKGNNWLIFQLNTTDGNNYTWDLLPYGKYKGYENGMKIRDNKFIYYGSIALMIMGGIFLFNFIKKKYKI